MTARTPSRLVPLAAQSREEPGAVLLARQHHERDAVLGVLHRRVVDGHLLGSATCAPDGVSAPR